MSFGEDVKSLAYGILRHKVTFELDAMNAGLGHGLNPVTPTAGGQSDPFSLSTRRGALQRLERPP